MLQAYFLALDESLDELKAAPSTRAEMLDFALVWKVQSCAAIQRAVFQSIPPPALIDTWAHTARIDAFCRSDRAHDWFRDGAAEVCCPIPELRARVERLAAQFSRTTPSIRPYASLRGLLRRTRFNLVTSA